MIEIRIWLCMGQGLRRQIKSHGDRYSKGLLSGWKLSL